MTEDTTRENVQETQPTDQDNGKTMAVAKMRHRAQEAEKLRDEAQARAEKAENKLAELQKQAEHESFMTKMEEKYGMPRQVLELFGDADETRLDGCVEVLKAWGDSLKPKSYAPKITDPAGHPSQVLAAGWSDAFTHP